jgi:UDP-MurNAc hydroxylase
MRIDTGAGSILCDPWVNPAFFASWFPFPDNSQLDWETLGQTDYLYVSHLHRDHFDAKHLRRFVSKKATVLLPEYPTSQLEDELRELGFTSFIKTVTNEVVELDGGLKIMIQALTSPTDGPIGDSSLWVEYDGIRVLNQNDARPSDLTVFAELGHVHAHMLQFSGAIWYPMVYELPEAAKTAFGKQKRDRQFDRTWRYIDDLNASWVFPIAGPPCFLDDELWQFNDIFGDEGNIFPDQACSSPSTARSAGTTAWCCCPARSPRGRGTCAVVAPGRRPRRVLRQQGAVPQGLPGPPAPGHRGREGVLAPPRDRRAEGAQAAHRAAAGRVDLPRQRRRRAGAVRPRRLRRRVGGVHCGGFPGKQVRRYADEKVRYRFRTERSLVEHLLFIEEVDWVNSLFLSCRFSAARIGQYNEFVYAFFKCLSRSGCSTPRAGTTSTSAPPTPRTSPRRLGRAAPVPAPQGRPHPLRHRGRRHPDLPAARLEVRPRLGQVPHQRRPPAARPPRRPSPPKRAKH